MEAIENPRGNPPEDRPEHILRFISDGVLDKIEKYAGRDHVCLLTLQLANFYLLADTYGTDAGLELLRVFHSRTDDAFRECFPNGAMLAMENIKINEKVIYLLLSSEQIGNLARDAHSFRVHLQEQVNAHAKMIGATVEIMLGFAWTEKNLEKDFYGSLLNALFSANRRISSNPDPIGLELHQEFARILRERMLENVYQPVVDFKTGRIRGWEALVRGPGGSRFEKPATLFEYAREMGLLSILETRCRELAVENLGEIASNQMLFLNLHAQSLSYSSVSAETLHHIVQSHGLAPSNVVLEFSEKQSLQNSGRLLEWVERYRELGFRIALDDVGAGYSSLESIPRFRPDFIKIDLCLVEGIDFNPLKRVMVETLLVLSEKLGCRVIAEGIETETELSSLISMGVHYGQGFHIARPAYPKAQLSLLLPAKCSPHQVGAADLRCSTPVRSLAQPALEVTPETTIEEVKNLLADKPPMSSVVIVAEGKPAGLLMSYDLDKHLGTKFGIPLFLHRQVSRLMDTAPLTVDAEGAVEEAAKAAMNRDKHKVYDDIIVTENGLLKGTISVQKILDTLAKVQVEMARGANPLTGLPGNVAIEQEINRRAGNQIASCLLYFDLDNFKVYNDAYGFENGDKVILFASEVLNQAVGDHGHPDDFIGHIGGDDFVVIARSDTAEQIAKIVAGRFDREIVRFYNEEDRARGYVPGKGRDGTLGRFPLVSVSIGILDCEFRNPFTMDELSHRIAAVKCYAKSIPGNSYVRDRRPPLGS